MGYVQEQMWQVTVVADTEVSPTHDLGVWDSFEGGDVDSDTKTYRPGGMRASVALPAPAQTSDVTISRGYQVTDADIEMKLINAIGRSITITKTPWDMASNAPVTGSALKYNGVIKSVRTPTHDSDGDRVTRLQLVAVINDVPTR